MKAGNTFKWIFAISRMLLCSLSAFGITGFEPSVSAPTVVIIGRLYLCSLSVLRRKGSLILKKEILNLYSCVFSTLGDFINTQNLQMYAIRLNANEASIDCWQQVNVLTRPKFKASEMTTFSKTAESRWLACMWNCRFIQARHCKR